MHKCLRQLHKQRGGIRNPCNVGRLCNNITEIRACVQHGKSMRYLMTCVHDLLSKPGSHRGDILSKEAAGSCGLMHDGRGARGWRVLRGAPHLCRQEKDRTYKGSLTHSFHQGFPTKIIHVDRRSGGVLEKKGANKHGKGPAVNSSELARATQSNRIIIANRPIPIRFAN